MSMALSFIILRAIWTERLRSHFTSQSLAPTRYLRRYLNTFQISLMASYFDLSTSHIISKKSGRVILKLPAFKALMSRFSSKNRMRYFFYSASLVRASLADVVLVCQQEVGVAVKLADEFKLISFHSSRFVGLTSYTISFATAALI